MPRRHRQHQPCSFRRRSDGRNTPPLALAEKMGIKDAEVINRLSLYPAEGTFLELKGRVEIDIESWNPAHSRRKALAVGRRKSARAVKENPMTAVVAATVGEDEHSVGMREIIDIKHGGIEGYGIMPLPGHLSYGGKVEDAAIETAAERHPHQHHYHPRRHPPHQHAQAQRPLR